MFPEAEDFRHVPEVSAKLRRNYAMDAIDAQRMPRRRQGPELRGFLDRMMSAAAERFPAIGEVE